MVVSLFLYLYVNDIDFFARFVMFNKDAAEGYSFVKNACEKGEL